MLRLFFASTAFALVTEKPDMNRLAALKNELQTADTTRMAGAGIATLGFFHPAFLVAGLGAMGGGGWWSSSKRSEIAKVEAQLASEKDKVQAAIVKHVVAKDAAQADPERAAQWKDEQKKLMDEFTDLVNALGAVRKAKVEADAEVKH